MSIDSKPSKQFNFNSFVGILCSGLVVFAITKLDSLNTAIIEQKASLLVLKDHLSEIDTKISSMVTRGEFSSALSSRDREIDALKKAIGALQARPGAAPRP